MKKAAFATFIAVLLAAIAASAAPVVPAPRGFVNDFANIIPDGAEDALEAKLRAYEKATTIEIAVVTVSSLEGYDVADYTIRLAEAWKVGKKGRDNGVIFLIAPNERKTRIEVGYGLESTLTDSRAKRILDGMLGIPREDVGGRVTYVVDGIIGALGTMSWEEREAEARREAEERTRHATAAKQFLRNAAGFVAGLIILFLLMRTLLKWAAERKRMAELVARAKREIPAQIGNLDSKLLTMAKQLDALSKDGWKLHRVSGRVSELTRQLTTLETAFKTQKKPDYPGINASLGILEDKVDETENAFKKLLEDHTSIAALIQDAGRTVKKAGQALEAAEEIIRDFRKIAPEAAWNDLEKERLKAADELARVEQKIGAIAQKDLKDENVLPAILPSAQAVKNVLGKPAELLAASRQRVSDFREGKEKAPRLFENAANEIKKAAAKVKDDDVEDSTKNLVKQAEAKLSHSKNASDDSPTNWIIVAALLAEAIALAKRAVAEAEDDVEEAARKRRYRSTSSYGSSWSSHDSSSSSSSSSFGGFGGGGFGGGGSSGGW